MIIGKRKGITIQIKKQGEDGTLSMTVHGLSKQEIYNRIMFLFQNLEQEGDVNMKFYNTKRRKEDENI